GIELEFTPQAIRKIAEMASEINSSSENIGARRLHTMLENLLEEISFEGPDLKEKKVLIDEDYVRDKLEKLLKNEDLRRYVL
ncbi:MAG TPA: hypothetical protein VNK26_03185, partial [Pyrinomonadaceae bacterium]|nr:hypothetical protein [Pyrinomonadaceae bacterium]